MSLDNIAASYFGCAESPIWIPEGFNVDNIPNCKSCTLRLTAPVPGSGVINTRVDGLVVEENPLTTLSVNGIQHNLVETVLMIGGAHRLPGRSEPCKAELACYFQSTRDFSQHACLCLPIDIGKGTAAQYFSTLGTLKTGRPTLAAIVPGNASFLLYRGADFRGRSANNKVPSSFCDPVKRVTTYYVCLRPVFMENADYTRLVGRAGKGLQGPPTPLTPVVNSRLKELTTVVNGISIGTAKPFSSTGSAAPLGGPGYPVKSMKCYRLDPNRDIVKDKVYVGGKKSEPLAKTLEKDDEGGILPGDLQRLLSQFLGITVAIIIAAFAFVFIFSRVFTNYSEAQYLYEENPISAHTISNKVFPGEVRMPSFSLSSMWQWICSKVGPKEKTTPVEIVS
jgi:hypothetical protein